MKKILAQIASVVILKVLRLVTGIPDHTLARILGWIEGLLRRLRKSEEELRPIAELRELAETDPQAMLIVRTLLREGRDAQFLSLIKGIMKHHTDPGEEEKPEANRSRAKRFVTATLRLGVVGDHPDIERLYRAYDGINKGFVRRLDPEKLLSKTTFSEEINGLEIADTALMNEEFLDAVLAKGVALSLHHSAVPSKEIVEGAFASARRHKTPLRVFYPHIHYPAVQKVKSLIADDEIVGEVTTIRIRATAGGRGGTADPALPDADRYLDHAAFDHFLLLAFFGGAVEKVAAYLNPMVPETGAQGLIDVKYTYPGRYGLLDCTYAPQMYLRSAHEPYDMVAEIAGTDGIVWLGRAMAERTRTAPITVRAGKKAFSIGVESGLECDWSHTYLRAARDFIALIGDEAAPLMSNEEILSAYALKARVYEAARASTVLPV